MNIPTLVIEANARVGDNWRKRYPTLTLHTIRAHHSCKRPRARANTPTHLLPVLYQSYPKNWPDYTPRDKLADWFEQYAQSQDLVVWTNTRLLPTPIYNAETKRWTMTVARDGKPVALNPAHIVLATGTLGAPRIPDIAGHDTFKGTILHASAYQGAKPFAGKKVVVVGAGNTSADICQDLVFHGAEAVTMVQRSRTCIITVASATAKQKRWWNEDIPVEAGDVIFTSLPMHMIKAEAGKKMGTGWEVEREMHRKLRETGFNVHLGENDAGNALIIFERLGGMPLSFALSVPLGD